MIIGVSHFGGAVAIEARPWTPPKVKLLIQIKVAARLLLTMAHAI